MHVPGLRQISGPVAAGVGDDHRGAVVADDSCRMRPGDDRPDRVDEVCESADHHGLSGRDARGVSHRHHLGVEPRRVLFVRSEHRCGQIHHVARLHRTARPQAVGHQLYPLGGVAPDLLGETATMATAHRLGRTGQVDDADRGTLHGTIVNHPYESHKRNCQLIRLR